MAVAARLYVNGKTKVFWLNADAQRHIGTPKKVELEIVDETVVVKPSTTQNLQRFCLRLNRGYISANKILTFLGITPTKRSHDLLIDDTTPDQLSISIGELENEIKYK